MSNSCLRFFSADLKEMKNKNAKWLNLYTTFEMPGVFSSSNPDNRASYFGYNNGIYDYNSDNSDNDKYDFTNQIFTICTWLKFESVIANKDNTVQDSYAMLRMDNGDILKHQLTVDSVWHHYCFTRKNDKVKFYLDGVLTETITVAITTEFNLSNKSFVYIGNPARNMTGNTFYADDIYLFRGTELWTENFTPPDKYLDVDYYYRIYKEEIQDLYAQKD